MSQQAPFIHLHVHSAYSLAEGAISLKDLAELCKAHGQPAVAVTDTGNLFGALEFSLAASKAGIQPIIGSQIWIAAEAKDARKKPEPDQLVLLVKNDQGYKNLMKLSSKAWLEKGENDKPETSWADLEELGEGLICLTGGVKGPVGRLLLEEQADAAGAALDNLHKIFGDRLYIELQRHGLEAEAKIEDALLDLAYDRKIPLVATNDCYFADADMYEAHDAFLCVSQSVTVAESNRRRVTREHYFKPSDEMRALFSDLPEAVENTGVIAKRCAQLLKATDPVLPKFKTQSGRSEPDEIRHAAKEGLDWRLEKYVYTPAMTEDEKKALSKQYHERLEYEIGVLLKMGYAGYFLIVADFIKWAKDHGIPVGPGRGSGAGSVVAWALRITDLDPIKLSLLFERFLNPERVSMPDFDVDFCQARRDEVISYVQNRYGHDRVAQIITFGKLQARAVVRDVGRVLGMPYGQVDKIAKLIPFNPANPVSLEDAIASEAQLQEARDSDDQVAKLMDIAVRLEGLYRHASTHAAGVVIGDRPLDEMVPLYQDPRSTMPATQFNMKYVEQAGLVKFDFLGLKTLTVIQDAITLIHKGGGPLLDPLAFPMDDEKTYRMLARGDCSAVFQLESAGMRDLCRQMHVKNFEEIIAIVALFRPGPMENIPKYLANLKGSETIEYMHPLLEPVLKDTYGVMIYQEQVMEAARVLAGYTLGGADLLRRAMGKKIKSEMDAQREIFIKGCKKANNIAEDLAGSIFDQIAKFADYGFNKAHSAVYAYIAYQTAWLKTHYPVEFMAATMTQEMGDTDKLGVFRRELQRMGIALLPPDINASEARFAVEKGAIRYALAALKGVGMAAMETVVAERASNGPFKDLFDFAGRLDSKVVNKRQMESLAAAGAFDSLNPNRAQVLDAVEMLLRYSAAEGEEKNSNQTSLFGGADKSIKHKTPELPSVPAWDPLEKLRQEFDAVGFYLSSHPLESMTARLDKLGVVASKNVADYLSKSPAKRLRMAGVVVKKQEKTSQKGNRFAFIQLSDQAGVYEAVMFSETLNQSRSLLEAGNTVLVTMDAEVKGPEEIRFICQKVEPLDKAVDQVTVSTKIVLDNAKAVDGIKAVLAAQAKGKVKLLLVVPVNDDKEAHIELPGSWTLPAETRLALRRVEGVLDVVEY